MKRILLFVATNVAVLALLSIVMRVLGIDSLLAEQGTRLDMRALLIFSAVIGFGGALISLAISKWTAKRMTGARVIDTPRNASESWLVNVVQRHAQAAGIGMPEVAIYDSPRDQCVCDRRAARQRARCRELRLAAAARSERDRGRAGARGEPCGQRRHGYAGVDPGRGEHVRRFLVTGDRLPRRSLGVSNRARIWPRVLYHQSRGADRARYLCEHDRDVVLEAA